jgi:hypothetical protein
MKLNRWPYRNLVSLKLFFFCKWGSSNFLHNSYLIVIITFNNLLLCIIILVVNFIVTLAWAPRDRAPRRTFKSSIYDQSHARQVYTTRWKLEFTVSLWWHYTCCSTPLDNQSHATARALVPTIYFLPSQIHSAPESLPRSLEHTPNPLNPTLLRATAAEEMSYAYLFKYIVIGDSGPVLLALPRSIHFFCCW